MSARRIFWGKTLAQAVAKAARHHGVAPELLDWRRHEKRHGFVRHPRAVLVEVDPEAPTKSGSAGVAAASAAASAPTVSSAPANSRGPAARPAVESPASPTGTAVDTPRPIRSGRDARPVRTVALRNEEPFEAPDEASELAARDAIGRLLRLVGAGLEIRSGRDGERISIALEGPDEQGLDLELLDDLEHLLPRSIYALCGRRVRAAVDCNGQREARAEQLRQLAREIAERVRSTGEAEALPPLPANERRIVHLLFEADPELVTDSLGEGALKRLRIARRDVAALS